MRYSNELKVGLSIIISAVIFILGVRYFEDLPLFEGTYELYTEFEDVEGLVNGNAVRINGVNVGAVEQVRLNPQTRQVRVRFHVDEGITIPEGSIARIAGFGALGGVRLDIVLGPYMNPPVEEGAFVPSTEDDRLAALTDRAPELITRVDSLLVSANAAFGGADEVFAGVNQTLAQADAALGRAGATFGEVDQLVGNADGDLRVTLAALRSTAQQLETLLAAQQARLGRVLVNFESLSGDLGRLSAENGDTLALAIQNLNRVLTRTDRNLASLELASASLDDIMGKIDRGEGTLGLLVNDPGLYLRMDSALVSLNRILTSFEDNPARYLKDLRLVDIF